MLRLAVLVLLLANAGYYAWSQGLLREWGWAPVEQSEPQRMQQQLHPESLHIARAAPAAAPPPPAPASNASETAAPPAPPAPEPAECLQAGVFDQRQADALRTAAASLPGGTWSLDTTAIAGRWMVYMGRFPDEEVLDKKREELRDRKVPYDRPGAAWEPGLSLGRFSTEEAAQRGLAQLNSQGVRTARVVQERTDATGYVLRLPAVDAALRARLDALRPALAGKTLRPCG